MMFYKQSAWFANKIRITFQCVLNNEHSVV